MNKYLKLSILFFAVFIAFTILVITVDVQAIGPNGSEVGFATINKAVFEAFGQNNFFYVLTELLGKTAILVCVIFGCVGAYQLFTRKSLMKVDKKIVYLGIFYIIVIAFYVVFNKVVVNYRPILEADGSLEASYPSSHTVLAICVFITAFMQKQLNPKGTKQEEKVNVLLSIILPVIMLVGRLLAGIHWFTDIIPCSVSQLNNDVQLFLGTTIKFLKA